MKKIAFVLMLGLVIAAVGAIKLSYAADDSAITNLQFAQFLVQKLNITLPPGADKLPQDQYYKAMADALAAKGINFFVNASPTGKVSSSSLVDVLYAIVGGKENLDSAGKLNYLVSNGFLAALPAGTQGKITMDYLQDVFNNPNLTTIIAETYTPPAGGPPAGEPGEDAPPETLENPADNPPASPI